MKTLLIALSSMLLLSACGIKNQGTTSHFLDVTTQDSLQNLPVGTQLRLKRNVNLKPQTVWLNLGLGTFGYLEQWTRLGLRMVEYYTLGKKVYLNFESSLNDRLITPRTVFVVDSCSSPTPYHVKLKSKGSDFYLNIYAINQMESDFEPIKISDLEEYFTITFPRPTEIK